ncbi:MAG: hypothetical protein M1480_05315 [Bacteroidetes bacterium]|nr:hypothetical protein [Bacteroidota bacterium]
MKMNFSKKIKFVSAIVIVAFFAVIYTSCDITNPTKNIAVIFNTLSLNTTASVNFIDAATNQQIGANTQQAINISFTGPDTDKIVTLREESLSTTSTNFGVISFGVRPDITPTPQNPVKVTLVASSNGYVTTSYPIIFQSTGSRSISISMISVSNPPQGTTTSTPTSVPTSNNGTTSSTVNVQTQSSSSTSGNASLSIPSGTTLSDANGNPVTGTLTATVTYSSGQNITSSGAMSSGLSVSFIDSSKSQSQGYIQPASVASFTITNQNGQVVHQLSQPVQLSLSVPNGTINPTTNATIKNGDIVPIYSYDETSQAWQFETKSTASGPDANGNFTLAFTATHLSNWLAGWINSGGQVCTQNITLNIVGDFSALMLKLKVSGTTVLTQNISSNQTQFVFNNVTVPKGLPVTIEAYSLLECPATLVGSVSVSDLCSQNNITLNVNPGNDRSDINVDVTAICADRDPVLKIKPNGYDIFVRTSCGDVNVGTLNNGKITLKGFILNTTYTFGVIYRGEMYSDSHLVDQTNYVFDYNLSADVCKDFK